MALVARMILTAPPGIGTFWYWIVVLCGQVALSPITILIHEAGHAAAAMAVGRRVYRINIGTGAPFRTIRLGQTEIVIGRDQSGGYVMCLPTAAESRWREACMVAAGPAANIGAMIALAGLAGALYGTGASAWAKIASVVVAASTVSNAWVGLRALLPLNVKLDGALWVSDGRRLLQLLLPRRETPDWQVHHDGFKGSRLVETKRWPEAECHYREALARYPDQPGFVGVLVHVLAASHGLETAVACVEQHLPLLQKTGEPEHDAAVWAFARANAAWAIIRAPVANLDLARELLSKALASDPENACAKATEGALWAREGRREDGAAQMVAALRDVAAPSDRLEFCEFILAAGLQTEGIGLADFEAYAAHLRALT
ncbi:MAG: site-2 protease family protein [Caulobacteraceae bacterium]